MEFYFVKNFAFGIDLRDFRNKKLKRKRIVEAWRSGEFR